MDAARIEPADHVLDRAVLPRRVASLEHHQQAMRLGAPHQVLQGEQLVVHLLEPRLRLGFLDLARWASGDVVQPHLGACGVEHRDVLHAAKTTRHTIMSALKSAAPPWGGD